tara:strand:- start:3392 stop:3667 length:276 start_codon:yes stop_codon:yes gene_type:complete
MQSKLDKEQHLIHEYMQYNANHTLIPYTQSLDLLSPIVHKIIKSKYFSHTDCGKTDMYESLFQEAVLQLNTKKLYKFVIKYIQYENKLSEK